jgi:hypothetical protein
MESAAQRRSARTARVAAAAPAGAVARPSTPRALASLVCHVTVRAALAPQRREPASCAQRVLMLTRFPCTALLPRFRASARQLLCAFAAVWVWHFTPGGSKLPGAKGFGRFARVRRAPTTRGQTRHDSDPGTRTPFGTATAR